MPPSAQMTCPDFCKAASSGQNLTVLTRITFSYFKKLQGTNRRSAPHPVSFCHKHPSALFAFGNTGKCFYHIMTHDK